MDEAHGETMSPDVAAAGGVRVRCVGSFSIRRGTNPIARLLARQLRLPPEIDDVPTTLRIAGQNGMERWERVFGKTLLVTTQRLDDDGLMIERFRFLELMYRVDRQPDCVRHLQVGAALRCGRLRVPLPRLLAPSVVGSETATGVPKQIRVQVDVRLPIVGVLLSYDGVVTMLETWP